MTERTVSPTQLYRGDFTVAAKPKLSRWFELRSASWHDLKTALEEHLQEAIPLPVPPLGNAYADRDLRLDIAVSHFQSGTHVPIQGILFAAVIWRPSVTLDARLVSLKSGTLIDRLTITRRLSWRQYLSILFSPFSRGPIRFGFGREDLLCVLNDACIELFIQITRRF